MAHERPSRVLLYESQKNRVFQIFTGKDHSTMITYREQPPTVVEFNQLRAHVGWGVIADTDAVEQGIRQSLFHITVWEGTKLIGMGRIIGDGAITFYIQDVIVRKEYQGQGIGFQIMERLMDYIGQTAAEGAVIGLLAAKGKEGFYEKFGFIPRPNEYFGKGMVQFWRVDKR